MQNLSHLFKSKRFLPLFITQFFGAFNDNVFKNALVIFIIYKIEKESGINVQILVTLVAFLFILPFFLFSALAGQLADRFDKAQIAKIIKFVEIFLMIFAVVGFYAENLFILMTILFLMGSHSAFFGPIKYGILPELLRKDEIIGGNGLISSATFVSILLGTIIGGLLIMQENGILILAFVMILSSLIGLVSSFFIPKKQSQSKLRISFNIFSQSLKIIRQAKQNRRVFLAIVGIAWFWFVGASFLAQFPNYAKSVLFGNNEIVTLLLTVFSIGIAIGSLICNRLLKGEISAVYSSRALILISIFTMDLYFSSLSRVSFGADLIGFVDFFKNIQNWRVLFDLLLIAICSGVYIVPLYAIIQTESKDENRARIIAALNIFDAGFMVASAVFSVILLKLNFTIPQIFLAISLINFVVVVYVKKLSRNKKKRNS